MDNMFIVGEWVTRRTDGVVGIVRGVQEYNDGPLYRVELQRPRISPEENTVLGSEGAWDRLHKVHAHVTTSSRDCDGDYRSGRSVELTAEERCDSFGDISFKERVIANVITVHGYGTLSVTPEGVEWGENTEEGYRMASVEWCEDNCPNVKPWHRDLRAEAAGY